MTPRFRPRTEAELYAMETGALLGHVGAAKRAEHEEQATLAMHMLLFRIERNLRRRVHNRIPPHLRHHGDVAADWVLERVMRSALRLQLEGESEGEWVNWWGTAVERQVVSFWRSSLGQSLEAQRPLPSEDDEGPDTLGEDFDAERVAAQACYSEIVQTVLGRMDNPMHVAVVRAAFWEDRASADIAEEFGTSAANVDQIKSRFRRDLRAECERRGVTGE